jgi:hypothetical protein
MPGRKQRNWTDFFLILYWIAAVNFLSVVGMQKLKGKVHDIELFKELENLFT